MKIGFIGAGNMARALGPLWQAAGHEVLYSSRHPHGADVVTVDEASAFGDVLVLAVNYWLMPEAVESLGDVSGRVLIDISNPIAPKTDEPGKWGRTIPAGETAFEHNVDLAPGASWGKAWPSLGASVIASRHHEEPRVAVGYAATDDAAATVTARLIEDAGFEPVAVGGVEGAALIEMGGAVGGKALTADEMRERIATSL